jgi:hypothetical protein
MRARTPFQERRKISQKGPKFFQSYTHKFLTSPLKSAQRILSKCHENCFVRKFTTHRSVPVNSKMNIAIPPPTSASGPQPSGSLGSDRSTSASRSTPSDQPFAQQFNYHLQDLPIVRRNLPPKPDGRLAIHLPDLSAVQVEYNRRETIESFRTRIQTAAPGLRIDEYYVVSRHGVIADGMTLDEYFLTPGADLILIRKGVGTRQQLMSRKFWIRSRQSADSGKGRPSTVLSPLGRWKAHRTTPYRTTKEALKFAQEHQ